MLSTYRAPQNETTKTTKSSTVGLSRFSEHRFTLVGPNLETNFWNGFEPYAFLDKCGIFLIVTNSYVSLQIPNNSNNLDFKQKYHYNLHNL